MHKSLNPGGWPNAIRPRVAGFLARVVFCLASSLIAGCGSGHLPTAAVKGTVLYHGRPLEFGSILFEPQQGPLARSTIGPDGRFTLGTYSKDDGAVLGEHRVRIACFESQRPGASSSKGHEATTGPSLIPRRYTNFSTSPLRVEVHAQNEPLRLELSDP